MIDVDDDDGIFELSFEIVKCLLVLPKAEERFLLYTIE